MEESYNGWTNRETWAVHLHITNDEGLYTQVREIWTMGIEDTLSAYARYLEGCFDLLWEDVLDGEAKKDQIRMLQDIGSLWRVNWDEIARALTEE